MVSRSGMGFGVLAIVCVLAVTGAIAQSGYAIDSPDTSPVPERSFDFQGETHTIDSRISASPGEEITVDVSAPDEIYRVYLYNGDEQIVDRQRGNGAGTFTFDLTDYEPGSYAITMHSRETDQHEAIMPLLVEGYDVSIDVPSSVDAEDSFEVTIDVSETAARAEPGSVTAVFVSDGDEHVFEASGGNGEYTVSVAAGDLDADTYSVYGLVQGDEQAFDRDELLGLDEGGSLTVAAAGESAEGESNSSGTGPGPETETPAATTSNETADSTDDETESAEQTTKGDAAITPDDAEPEAQTTVADGPGFDGVHLALAIGVCLGVVGLRRRVRTD